MQRKGNLQRIARVRKNIRKIVRAHEVDKIANDLGMGLVSAHEVNLMEISRSISDRNTHHVIKGVNKNGVHHNCHIVRMGRNKRRKGKLGFLY